MGWRHPCLPSVYLAHRLQASYPTHLVKEIAIQTQNLTKTFEPPSGWRRLAKQKGTTAVQNVNLTVQTGELFGLLGPNGAGKTTLVKILCTLILPTDGTAAIAGYPLSDSGRIREHVGLAVTDERSFYWRLTARQNLQFFATLYGLRGNEAIGRIQTVLESVNLEEYAERPFSSYSSGMKQRLAIARSLLHRPRILFLDEPSRSLDPVATIRLHNLILELMAQQEMTIFLITHDLSEAEKLCDRVAVMHEGRIQVIGRPSELRRQLQPQQQYALWVDRFDQGVEEAVRPFIPDLKVEQSGAHNRLLFQTGESDGSLTPILDALRQNGVTINSIEGHPPSLEEVFAHFTSENPPATNQPINQST
jgi:ABC-2 type transport system ATP-binding protein